MSDATIPSRIGVCSWSLRPESPTDLVASLDLLGISTVQLDLGPLLDEAPGWLEAPAILTDAKVRIASGMLAFPGEDYSTLESIRATGGVAPDERWDANLDRATRAAALAKQLQIHLVTCHAGFIPEEPDDPSIEIMQERLSAICDVFEEHGVELALETGQEHADSLLLLLSSLDRSSLGVNFDPANMILYGMGDPTEGFRTLAPFVKQVHVKDALPAETLGEWGREVPVGDGAVGWSAFCGVLQQLLPKVDLMIEREAGEDRIADIAKARDLLFKMCRG
ncbi:MAG: sugar phosphate isomerase/epimerase family protein [Phycisphaerales bacterium]